MAIEPADPLHDVELSLIEAGISSDVVRGVIRASRVRWGGGEVYIRKRDPMIEGEMERALRDGEDPARVARKVGVSVSTIRRRRSAWLG